MWDTTVRRIANSAVIGFVLIAGLLVPASIASAEPATPVIYPSSASSTRTTSATAMGFDTCTAPSLAALGAWRASPYRTVNIYFGGANRGCTQPNLTPAWVREVAQMPWRLLPTYMGFQPFCTLSSKIHKYTLSSAASVGASNGRDAVILAAALGLRPGSALYADVEHYDRTASGCITAVRRYVSAWTKTLHDNGYLAGVYVHQDSGLRDLSTVYTSTTYARPDAVWMARWDNNPSLTNWPTAPNTQWSFHQRAKQYRGDHTETWGGVTLNIDSDSLDAPVATVALPYQVRSTTTTLMARSGPSASYPVVATYPTGATISVVCQVTGQRIGTTAVWDRLSTGTWVPDYHVSTPSKTTYSAPLQRCSYPGQVTSSTPLNTRTGPGASYPMSGSPLQPGALAWVMCQKAGSTVGTTSVWNRMTDGRWVTDYYVSNRSNTTYSAPVPRCP
jgi:uncharacterized protein YraI